jgi:mRNA interferase MazF
MRRGEIWTAAGGRDYAGKPRPVVIVQDDRFDATDSITVCAFTTDPTEAPLFRLPVAPNERNGLRSACRLMVDKITTVAKTKLGSRVGGLDDEDMLRLNRAMLVFLGLAGAAPKV